MMTGGDVASGYARSELVVATERYQEASGWVAWSSVSRVRARIAAQFGDAGPVLNLLAMYQHAKLAFRSAVLRPGSALTRRAYAFGFGSLRLNGSAFVLRCLVGLCGVFDLDPVFVGTPAVEDLPGNRVRQGFGAHPPFVKQTFDRGVVPPRSCAHDGVVDLLLELFDVLVLEGVKEGPRPVVAGPALFPWAAQGHVQGEVGDCVVAHGRNVFETGLAHHDERFAVGAAQPGL